MRELPPKLLARFTQLDYDRELALVALWEDEIVAVGRYAPREDSVTADFALHVGRELTVVAVVEVHLLGHPLILASWPSGGRTCS